MAVRLIAITAILLGSLSNFWIFWVFKESFILGELLLIETILLFFLASGKFTKLISILILTIILGISSYLLISHFDNNIFSKSSVEAIIIRQRQQFYGKELGRIYGNKLGIYYFDNLRLYFTHISKNLFSTMDLSLYFSPRNPIDREKFPLLTSILFVWGFIKILRNFKNIFLFYLFPALVAGSFINSNLGPVLMFPFIALCITLGIAGIVKSLKI